MQLKRYLFLALALLQPAWAATLGEVQVRSALGERFNARINVMANEGEELERRCFRLLPSADLNAPRIHANLMFEGSETGGVITLQGDEPLQEPLVSFSIRLHCNTEKSASFQRDYSALLDPREYKSQRIVEKSLAPAPARRALPAFASVWHSQEGDSVERIARAYFPQDSAKKARMVDEIYRLNPDLAQNTHARLALNSEIRLPDRSSLLSPAAVSGANAEKPSPAPARPAMQADALQISTPPAAPMPGFMLRMSDSLLAVSKKNQLSPEESLLARERLQILESDDQTAQLLQYKYQISQLEKQLAALKENTSPALELDAVQERGRWLNPWWLLLLLLPLGWWLITRWSARSQPEAFSQSILEDDDIPMVERLRDAVPSRGQVMGMVNNFSQAASDWSRDDVDVVQPKNVAEEAQMLLDHGLTVQAVNLLNSEIEQHPSALALWMNLFDIYAKEGMRQEFQNRAVGFRLQFSSDSLWQQVQRMGRSIDEDNPLYLSIDENLDLPFELEAELEPPEPAKPADEIESIAWDNQAEQQFNIDIVPPQIEPSALGTRVNLADYASQDPALQSVIEHLKHDDLQAACDELEQLLYRGNMEQRQLAVKWLDTLIPLQM